MTFPGNVTYVIFGSLIWLAFSNLIAYLMLFTVHGMNDLSVFEYLAGLCALDGMYGFCRLEGWIDFIALFDTDSFSWHEGLDVWS